MLFTRVDLSFEIIYTLITLISERSKPNSTFSTLIFKFPSSPLI